MFPGQSKTYILVPLISHSLHAINPPPPRESSRSAWDSAPSAHLAVGEDGGVVAVEAALDEAADAGVVHLALRGAHVEHVVVGEGLVRAQPHLRLVGRDARAHAAHLDQLARDLRTDPAGGGGGG